MPAGPGRVGCAAETCPNPAPPLPRSCFLEASGAQIFGVLHKLTPLVCEP